MAPETTEKEKQLEVALESMQGILAGYESQIQTYESIGSIEDIAARLETLKAYEELGTPDEIKAISDEKDETIKTLEEVKAQVTAFESLGGETAFEELKKENDALKEKLEAYESLGDPEEINEVIGAYESDLMARTAKDLGLRFKVDESVVTNLLNKLDTHEEVVAVLESIRPASAAPAPTAVKANESAPAAPKPAGTISHLIKGM